MPTIPVFQRENKLSGSALPYQNLNTKGAFGEDVTAAMGNAADAVKHAANVAFQLQQNIEETKAVELSNNIEQWCQANLFDKDNGYYYKMGKDAVGKSKDVLKSLDDLTSDYVKKAGFSPRTQQKINQIVAQKRTRIAADVNRHDMSQTNFWAKTEGEKAVDNAINAMIHDRNNPDSLAIHLNTGIQAIRWQADIQKFDEATTNAMIADFKSKGHEAVLSSMIADGNLAAGDYFKKHENELKPEVKAKYIGAIRNEKLKYDSRAIAEQIFLTSKNEQEAIKRAESIKDVELSDRVVSNVRGKYAQKDQFENQQKKELLEGFFQDVINARQNGETLSFDKIPNDLDAKTKLSLMNYINSNGNPETDSSAYNELYEMSVNNAQGFAQLDLNRYRGYLSDGEFKSFQRRQEDIKTGAFYTQIKDDDKMINEALESMGLKSNKKQAVAHSEIKALVRALEARKGRKATDEEIMNITNSLGYKSADGLNIYNLVEYGMNKKVGFIKDCMNDIVYYQKTHNGQMPSNEEKYIMFKKRALEEKKVQDKELLNSFSQREVSVGDIWQGHRITSPYGKRIAPKTGATTNHKGVDLAYKNNEAFSAFASGVVTNVGFDSKLGNYVDIVSNDGVTHRYGHANKIVVKKGDKVRYGDKIGLAGSTGVSTGPHVHYAKIKNGSFINPIGTGLVANKPEAGWAF